MTATKRVAALFEVPLTDGTVWRGTEAQLRTHHPSWMPYAKRVQHASSQSVGHSAGLHPDDQSEDEEADDLLGYPEGRNVLAPKSAVQRYRNDRYFPALPDKQFEWHVGQPPPVQRASRRSHGNPNKATPPDVIYAQSAQRQTEETAAQPKRRRRHVHPLLYLGIGMLVMLALWQAGIQVMSWWQVHQDDARYGRPRTYQVDAVVGHDDSPAHPSHFIAENLHSRVVVYELPGGDAAKTRVYVGPQLYGPNADLDPVTLTFPRIHGEVAMIVNVQDSQIVYLNQKVKGVWQFIRQGQ